MITETGKRSPKKWGHRGIPVDRRASVPFMHMHAAARDRMRAHRKQTKADAVPDEKVIAGTPEFSSMGVRALRSLASTLGIKGAGRMRKDELVAAVEERASS